MASHPPIPISELADHTERLKANDNLKFSQEYEVGMLIICHGKSPTWGNLSGFVPRCSCLSAICHFSISVAFALTSHFDLSTSQEMNCVFIAFAVVLLSTQMWEENLNCKLKDGLLTARWLSSSRFYALVDTEKIEIKKHPQRANQVIQGTSVLCTQRKILISFLLLAAQLIWSNNSINCVSELSVHADQQKCFKNMLAVLVTRAGITMSSAETC